MERELLINVSEKKGPKLSTEHCALVTKYFSGCERISAIPAKYYSGMGNRIEIYDLQSPNYVGAIYPDGASMVWPMCWYENNSETFNPRKHKISYSDIMNGKKIPSNKRVALIDDPIIPLRTKIKRRILNG